MAANGIEKLADYMEAIARRQNPSMVKGYGYQADVALGVGFLREENHGCKTLEKPVIIPSGTTEYQAYMMLFAYTQKAGLEGLLQGQLPPVLPATTKEPKNFESLTAIADNFGAKDPQAAAVNTAFCVALRVPIGLATKAEVEGRDIWMVRFDQDKISPFLQAVKEGDVATVKQGLAAGISGAVVDEDFISALMIAAMSGNSEMCEALLEGGADVNHVEPQGNKTALMFAAQSGSPTAVQLLLTKNGDPSKVDNEGATPLMWAAVSNKADCAKVLASQGLKDVRNKEGLTALEVAQRMGESHAAAAAVLA